MSMYDCAIIGGGLAGLSLSIQLARRGFSVILFEKERYPFHKVCGEYIAMESWDFLCSLGVPLESWNLPRIRHLQISAPAGGQLDQPLNPGGFGISRYLLDGTLAGLAQAAGVTLCEKTRIQAIEHHNGSFTLSNANSTWKALSAAGTWGKFGNLDTFYQRRFTSARYRRQAFVGVKYHIQAEIPADLISLHTFAGGYCGISRVENGHACLCYLASARDLRRFGQIEELEKQLLSQNPRLKTLFSQINSLYPKPLVIAQVHFRPKTTQENHLLLAGDTAGLIAPLCGNGMSMALHTSKLLANLLSAHLQGWLPQRELEIIYQREWKALFETRLNTGYVLQNLLRQPGLSQATLKLLQPFPGVVGKLVELTHGEKF